jgi:hypothetical protein
MHRYLLPLLAAATALLNAACIDSKTPTESSATGVILSGVVVDEAGTPREGVSVTCQGQGATTSGMGAIGAFKVGGLQPGISTVSLGQPGMRDATKVEVELHLGTNTQQFTLARYRGSPATVSGLVTQGGHPLANASVSIASGRGVTGPDGAFQIAGLESGWWGLEVIWGAYLEWDEPLTLSPGANVVNVVIP